MAFSFGSAGATTAQPLFGGTGTAATSGFGGFGTGLGTTASNTGGMLGFGQPATTQTTGFSFGLPTATTSGSTGFSFGAPTTTTAATGFGGFGASTASTGAFSFGTTTTTSSAPTFGANTGFGGLGSSTGTTNAASTGFGTAGSTGFGTTKPAFNFGTGTGTTFGTGTGTGTTFGTGTGTTFGTGTGTGTIFGTGTGTTFGTGTAFGTGTSIFGQPQQPQQQQENALANLAMAVSLPQIFGDERDAIIARWNQLQACWGSGKGYFNQSGGFVEFKPDNPFCRFKAVGYHVIPTGRNEDGLVALVLNKKENDVSSVQQQVVDTITRILARPTLSVCVEGIRPMPEDRTELIIYVIERPAQGPAKRVPAQELCNFFQQQAQWSQLTSQLAAERILPKMGWTPEQIKEYLNNPPAGIDPLLWRQAKLDNPDPDRLVPVPMVGFRELQRRLKHQQEETKLHQQRLDVMAGDLSELQTQHSQTLAKLDDYKRKHLELGHRLLKVIVKQEICRKLGYAIQAEEETLKVQLEQLQVELNHPTQFKGRLNELMSQIRMQSQAGLGWGEPAYQMDTHMQAEIKQILKQQQEGLQHLIDIIKTDSENLTRMEQLLAASRVGR
ncbi:nucleoporin p54-like isoform X2 [Pomacea canaliculata]|uniref:nucleoporin p54-like isoform X2 n=1 Tax=Pomacea canaliculata TaxID=400727 RepID=UPI000D734B1B|nr:nucleoporin p54-like isoform X2 [Pomacea canaliculata]